MDNTRASLSEETEIVKTETPILSGPNSYALAILMGLQRKGAHIYEGTVPSHVKARRRAKNKVARQSRKANRG